PPPTPISTLFPYTTLFRSLLSGKTIIVAAARGARSQHQRPVRQLVRARSVRGEMAVQQLVDLGEGGQGRLLVLAPREAGGHGVADRKSTRLNSSHGSISYA